MTDFFEQQRAARRRAVLFCALLILAVIVTTIGVYGVVQISLKLFLRHDFTLRWWNPAVFAGSTIGTLAVTAYFACRAMSDAGGSGTRLAVRLGGRLVEKESATPAERQLLNVVEEMSIAVGIHPPRLFVLDDERCLNAFAAGQSAQDAVLGVTRGTLRHLTRDELQGIIAHEFSHILCGDMKVNLRMIGGLSGLEGLKTVGSTLCSAANHPNGWAFWLIGGLFWALGSIGAACAKWVKAAVNRECEFRADAKAVEMTRNPLGLASALRKVGGAKYGSQLRHAMAGAITHLTFAPSAYAQGSHPPLGERIRRLFPAWDGSFVQIQMDEREPEDAYLDFLKNPSPTALKCPPLGHLPMVECRLSEEMAQAALTESGAAAILVAPVFQALHPLQRTEAAGMLSGPVSREHQRLSPTLNALPMAELLVAVDAALPVLRRLDLEKRQNLAGLVSALADLLPPGSLRAFAMRSLVARNLLTHPDPPVRYKKLSDVREDAAVILWKAAHLGGDSMKGEAAFRRSVAPFIYEFGGQLSPPAGCDWQHIMNSLERLRRLTVLGRQTIIRIAARLVAVDGCLIDDEADFLRGICDQLGVPTPHVTADDAA